MPTGGIRKGFGKRVRAGMLVGGALVLAGALGTAPASAVDLAGKNQAVTTAAGKAAWFHNGDKLKAYDKKADGKSIVAEATASSGVIRTAHAAGKGNTKTVTWNLREGTNLKIRMCYRKGAAYLKCSDWQKAQA